MTCCDPGPLKHVTSWTRICVARLRKGQFSSFLNRYLAKLFLKKIKYFCSLTFYKRSDCQNFTTSLCVRQKRVSTLTDFVNTIITGLFKPHVILLCSIIRGTSGAPVKDAGQARLHHTLMNTALRVQT